MHLNQKRCCLGVLLIYTITTITLPSVGWCEPIYSSQRNSHLSPHNVRNSDLTTKILNYPSSREGKMRQHFDSRQGKQESTNLPVFDHFENRDGSQTKTSGGTPEQKLRPRMTSSSDKSFKNRHKLKQTEGDLRYRPHNLQNEDCIKGNIKHVIHGKVYMIVQPEPRIPNLGYQSDSAVSGRAEGGQARIRGQWLSGSEESWQRLQPVVECGDDTMTLIFRRRRAVHLLLDRVNESSKPLSQLPPQCGYSVQTTWRDLSIMAKYDACHVKQEDDSYVLLLLLRGIPLKMSCPVSQIQSHDMSLSSLCCSPYGMTVKVQVLSAKEELSINVRGEWTPLVSLAEQCGYTLDRKDAEIVITAPYHTCGLTVKDGKYTLSLQIGEKSFKLSCPVSPPEDLPLTHQPLVDSPHHRSRGPTEPIPETLQPFPWVPPFYLAPPYYPHPTYHHKYPSPDVHDAHNPPTPSSLTPKPSFGPQTLPPVDSQPDYPEYHFHKIPVRESYKQFGVHSSLSSTDEMEDSSWVNPDLQQKQGTPVLGLSDKHSAAHYPFSATGFPIQVEAPSLQPPSHAFNPYYHYYHHPKIPLPGPTQDHDPGPEVPEELSSTNSHTLEFPVLLPNVQQSEAYSDQFPQPVPEAFSHPYILPPSTKFGHKTPAPHAPYPQPYPYHYFYYFPHIARGEAKRLAPLHRDMAAATNLSYVHPLSHSSLLPVHDKYNVNAYIDQPDADERINIEKYSPDWIKNPLLSEYDNDDVKPVLDDRKRQSTPVTTAVQPLLPPNYTPDPDPVAAPRPKQPSFPTPSNHNHPPYPYYYHPYYHYYQMYYGPESLQNADNHMSPASSKEASDPLLQASSFPVQHPSYCKFQITTLPKESMYDDQNSCLHPYCYYYQLFYQPKVSKENQELPPAGSMDSEKASSKSESQLPSDSEYSGMDIQVHAAEAGHPSIPWPPHNPFHSFYSHYMTQQHQYDLIGHPGEEAEEMLDYEMTDRLKANTYMPSASPCGLGPVSDFDCSESLCCCRYPVKVSDSVMEPTVAPSAHSSENSNVSCTVQWLNSHPDIYIVPLDGCGVNKHVFGQTVVHLLEVHNSVHENSPVRLMVDCSSFPGSLGELRLHLIDQPSPSPIQSRPATVNVQLRIATDESFTSYHPEAHLPLSLMRGRPLYLEVSLLDSTEPNLVLLVHSCLAYTQAQYTSWMPIYDGCPSRVESQLLPSLRSDSHHIRRVLISSFLSLPSESPTYMAKGGYSLLEDPEIYVLCLTEVCSAADSDCSVGCINSLFSKLEAQKEKWEVV